MSRWKTNVNERMHSSLANTGRAAGDGISSDNYSEESGKPKYNKKPSGMMTPSDYLSPKERAKLNGPVITIKKEE